MSERAIFLLSLAREHCLSVCYEDARSTFPTAGCVFVHPVQVEIPIGTFLNFLLNLSDKMALAEGVVVSLLAV